MVFLRPRSPARGTGWGLACRVGLCLLLAAPLPAAEAPLEYQIKAAFLFKFTKFVEWPEWVYDNEGQPLVMGILGKDPFGPYLDRILVGKKVRDRPVEIRRFASLENMEYCHVLFVSRSEEKKLEAVIDSVGRDGILTVSDLDGFAARGGAIQFVLEDDKVRFAVNPDAAGRAGLKISSRFLKLARLVGDGHAVKKD